VKLHTRRFETAVPASLLKLDNHSKLILDMAYTYEGTKVVWDVGAAWWFRDSQERAYLGLWRQPRPPSTAKLELRNRFSDLQGQRSPYDAAPVRDSADSISMSMMVQVPGTKEGRASADLAYGLILGLDGHPSPEDISVQHGKSLQAIRILEHGTGQDVAASSAGTLSTPENLSPYLNGARGRIQDEAEQKDYLFGKDIRGRLFSQDVNEYLIPNVRTAVGNPAGQSGGVVTKITDGGETLTPEENAKQLRERAAALRNYWRFAPGIVHSRELWHSFLMHNHLPESSPHEEAVLAAESTLNAVLAGGPPDDTWAQGAKALADAYASERRRITRTLKSDAGATYHPRQSPCSVAAQRTSGKEIPVIGPIEHSLDEFYPPALARKLVEGLVVLSVRVDAAGCVTEAAVTGSSGSDEMDTAALRWVETASYLPAERAGVAVGSKSNVAVDFRLRN
jgi:TonB family protein